jgi:RNA polymerase sigma-70 factor (ECF subfamily)
MGISTEKFNQMVANHTSRLMQISVGMVNDKHEAEDVVQEAFSSAWNSRHLFAEGKGSERAWLTTILKRRAVDRWRKPKPPSTTFDGNIAVLTFDVDPAQNEFSPEVQRALNQLSDCVRETFLLVAVQGYTHQEAATHLGIPLGTALSRVSKARIRLHKQLVNFRG